MRPNRNYKKTGAVETTENYEGKLHSYSDYPSFLDDTKMIYEWHKNGELCRDPILGPASISPYQVIFTDKQGQSISIYTGEFKITNQLYADHKTGVNIESATFGVYPFYLDFSPLVLVKCDIINGKRSGTGYHKHQVNNDNYDTFANYSCDVLQKYETVDEFMGIVRTYHHTERLKQTFTLNKGVIHGEVSTRDKYGNEVSEPMNPVVHGYAIKCLNKDTNTNTNPNTNTDKDSCIKKDGPYVEYTSSGKILIKCTYKNGLLHGKYEEFYKVSGNLKKLYMYNEGVKHGECIDYSVIDKVIQRANYVNDKKDGLCIKYYSSGKIASEQYYSNGERTGRTIEYDSLGVIQREDYYVNNVLTGVTRRYIKGKILVIQNYVNGLLNGEYTEFHLNGIIKLHTYYKECSRHGEHITYYPNGKMKSKRFYCNGRITGELLSFSERGGILEQGFYDNGKKTGEYKEFHENGKLKTYAFYLDNKIVGKKKQYDEDGIMTIVYDA